MKRYLEINAPTNETRLPGGSDVTGPCLGWEGKEGGSVRLPRLWGFRETGCNSLNWVFGLSIAASPVLVCVNVKLVL